MVVSHVPLAYVKKSSPGRIFRSMPALSMAPVTAGTAGAGSVAGAAAGAAGGTAGAGAGAEPQPASTRDATSKRDIICEH